MNAKNTRKATAVHIHIVLTTVMGMASAAAAAAAPPPSAGGISVLIVDGFSNHDWQAGTRMLRGVLQRDRSMVTTVSTVPEAKTAAWQTWSPDFQAYDVVVQNCNDIGNGRSWPLPAREALERYLRDGGGMLVYHSANNAFPEWSEYNRMIGLGWRDKNFGPGTRIEDDVPVRIPAGEGGNTSHGARVNALITRIGDHSIHRGLPRQWLAADLEIYRYARGPAENMEVLSYARDSKTGIDFPIEWTVAYGKGRVYNSTFGHYWHDVAAPPPGARCVGFQTLFLRAVRWLAGKEVGSDVPDNFPSRDQVSLYGE